MAKLTITVGLVMVHDGDARRAAFFGDVVDVSATESRRLVGLGAAEKVRAASAPEAAEAATDAPAEADVVPEGDAASSPAAPDRLPRPRNTAPRDAWLAYAAEQGLDEAASMTRDELIKAVG